MPYENKKKFIVNFAFYGIIITVIALLFKYALQWLLPFVVAFAASAIINPFARKVSEEFKVNKKFAACFSAFLFLGIAAGLIFLAGFGVYSAFSKLFFSLPSIYAKNIEPVLSAAVYFVEETLATLDPTMSAKLSDVAMDFLADVVSFISSLSVSAISLLSGFIANIPYYLITTIVTIISTFFICSSYETIINFILRQIPQKYHPVIKEIKTDGIRTVGKYLKSYILIMGITFAEVFICLSFLKVANANVFATIIAIFDIMPILGSGGILIPWGILALIQGRYAFGIGILVTYGIVTVIRQIIEPKIIGDQVGLPPIVTLMAMFVGVRLLGIIGLFGFPISLVIIKNLNDSGKIHIFK